MTEQEKYFERYKEKLWNLLMHCKKDIRFYRENPSFGVPTYDDFTYSYFTEKIPVLEKDFVREDSMAFLDSNIPKENFSVDSTSGTEGKPIICYRSNKERFMCSNSLWKLRRRFLRDIKPSDCFARFYAFRNNGDTVVANQVIYKQDDNDILLPLFDLSEDKLIGYWNEILKYRPRWLHGPSATIYNLALAVEQNHLQPYHFEFVELSGEYVQKEHKEFIEKVFDCPIADQYGCREYWPMAYSDLEGRLQVVTDNIYMEEIYNKEHGENELLITLLKNDTWPLVRYRLCDLGNLSYEDDRVYLNIIQGRKADFFVLSGNKRFNAIVFSGLARAICELYGFNVILQFQIVKESASELRVRLRLDEGATKEVLEKYRSELQKIIGENIKIVMERTDYIKPDPKTGKTREYIELG